MGAASSGVVGADSSISSLSPLPSREPPMAAPAQRVSYLCKFPRSQDLYFDCLHFVKHLAVLLR